MEFRQLLSDLKTNVVFNAALSAAGIVLHRKFEASAKNVRKTQLDLLAEIIQAHKDTVFGRDHGFSKIETIADYRLNVKIHSYDDLAPYIRRTIGGEPNVLLKDEVIGYATTSGTTGDVKYIPITKKLQKESHQKIARHFAFTIQREFPRAYFGKLLTIVSPAEEGKAPDGKPFGSTSGMLLKNLGKTFADKYALPLEVLGIEDYETKYFAIALVSLGQDITLVSTANPSTLLVLAQKMNERSADLIRALRTGALPDWLELTYEEATAIRTRFKKNEALADHLASLMLLDAEGLLRPKHLWPHLQLISCWKGGNCAAYIEHLPKWYGNLPVKDLGYLATEIRAGVNLTSATGAGALTINENFFEFIEASEIEAERPRILLADELEIGKQYYIFFTTKGGLYRYHINDIVEVTEFYHQVPCVRFVQKGKGVTSLTGEKLYEQQVIEAVRRSEEDLGVKLDFYLCHANLRASRYDLYADFGTGHVSRATKLEFALRVDKHLKALNLEYKVKRSSSRLGALQLNVLQVNSYSAFKKWRVSQGVREGQFKVTPLTQDEKFLTPLFVVEEIEHEPDLAINQ